MEKIITPISQPLRNVGGPVTNNYFQSLTEEFKKTHPTEQSTVFIPKELIRQTIFARGESVAKRPKRTQAAHFG